MKTFTLKMALALLTLSVAGCASDPGSLRSSDPYRDPVRAQPQFARANISFTEGDIDLVARTMNAEAGNQGDNGLEAVADVIVNRVIDGRYGDGIRGVVMHTYRVAARQHRLRHHHHRYARQGMATIYAFSCWGPGMGPGIRHHLSKTHEGYERAYEIAYLTLAGRQAGLREDVTNGATLYHARYVRPKWAHNGKAHRTVTIGDHMFYAENDA